MVGVLAVVVIVMLPPLGSNYGSQYTPPTQGYGQSNAPSQAASPYPAPSLQPGQDGGQAGQYGGGSYGAGVPQQPSVPRVSDADMLKWAEMLRLDLYNSDERAHLNFIIKGSLQTTGDAGLYKGMQELETFIRTIVSLPGAVPRYFELVRTLYDRAEGHISFEQASQQIYDNWITPSTGNAPDPKTGQPDPFSHFGANGVYEQRQQLKVKARQALISLFGM